jgi:hypothetical protein
LAFFAVVFCISAVVGVVLGILCVGREAITIGIDGDEGAYL